MSDALKEATAVLNDTTTLYDGAAYRKIIARLVQLIVTERRRSAEDLRELKRELEA